MAKIRTGRAPANENGLGLDPLAVTIHTACNLTALSCSSIYREIGSGRLLAIKAGKRTLIPIGRHQVMARQPAANRGITKRKSPAVGAAELHSLSQIPSLNAN